MARTLYACGPADLVAKVGTGTADGDYRPDTTPLSAYTTRTGGTALTDLQTLANQPTSTLVADVNGKISFYGPDPYTAGIWVGVGATGLRSVVMPADLADRLTTVEASGGATVPAGTYAPFTHAASHATAGADPVTPGSIGAAATGHTHLLDALSDVTAPTPAVGDVLQRVTGAWVNGQQDAANMTGLAAVATSGSFNDLVDRPQIASDKLYAVNGVYPQRPTIIMLPHAYFVGVNAPPTTAGGAVNVRDFWDKTSQDQAS